MQLRYMSPTTGKGGTSGPTLYVPDKPDVALPKNPMSGEWRYFATIDGRDDLLSHRPYVADVIQDQGYFIDTRMI